MIPPEQPRAARFLEQVLLLNFFIHLIALFTMAIVALPGVPEGTGATPLERATYVATHPLAWKLAWLPWHLCAVIDLLMGIALVVTRWVPKIPAVLTLLVTCVAVLVEQSGEIPWTLQGPALAALDPQLYLRQETIWHWRVVVAGASLYLLMAWGWTWCFWAAGTWSRTLTWLSLVTWTVLLPGCVLLLLPKSWQLPPTVFNTANGIGFPLLLLWTVLVTEEVLRRARPQQAHGWFAPWRHPWRGPVGWLISYVAQSRFLRACGEWLPMVALRSDITDVVYINYLVPAERLQPFVPQGLELQRLGPHCERALFSSLTYKHGGFGPALYGPLRRFLPSPVQSNWRIYVRDPLTGKEGIYFVTTAISSTLHALGARMLAEGLPMHVTKQAEVKRSTDCGLRVLLDPGAGTAPDLQAELHPCSAKVPAEWADCFADYEAFLTHAVPQDRALVSQPWYDRVVRQEICLGIPLKVCVPLAGEVVSRAAARYVGDAIPVCFHVPSVAFLFSSECYDARPVADAPRRAVAAPQLRPEVAAKA
jgi:hypothetical protein